MRFCFSFSSHPPLTQSLSGSKQNVTPTNNILEKRGSRSSLGSLGKKNGGKKELLLLSNL